MKTVDNRLRMIRLIEKIERNRKLADQMHVSNTSILKSEDRKLLKLYGENNMKNNRLANNIGILRTVFGETQLDLALVLGFNSPNTISNYESGNRKPNDETIRKLARHYRITEYELCNVDLSDCLVAKNLFAKDLANTENRNKEILKTFFPIVCTKEAKKNENFLKTNNRHRELIDKLSENFNEDYVDELYFEIDEVYSDLFFENNDYVSLANSLGIQCYTEFLEKFNEEYFSGNKIENLPSNPKYKDVYLRPELSSQLQHGRIVDFIWCFISKTFSRSLMGLSRKVCI